MAKGIIAAIVIVVLVLLGVYLFSFSNDSDNTNSENGDDSGEMKTFVLTGENFKFMMNGVDNPEIRVSQGDRVRIEFTSVGGFHDWKVDEFNAATEQVNDGEGMTSVEFVADQTGTFEYYCSVGQHRANGMKGSLVVE